MQEKTKNKNKKQDPKSPDSGPGGAKAAAWGRGSGVELHIQHDFGERGRFVLGALLLLSTTGR